MIPGRASTSRYPGQNSSQTTPRNTFMFALQKPAAPTDIFIFVGCILLRYLHVYFPDTYPQSQQIIFISFILSVHFSLHVSAPTTHLQVKHNIICIFMNRQNKRDKDYQLRLRICIWEVFLQICWWTAELSIKLFTTASNQRRTPKRQANSPFRRYWLRKKLYGSWLRGSLSTSKLPWVVIHHK
jgi:hypothetical protein